MAGDGADARAKVAARIRALLSKTVENGCTEAEALSAAALAADMLARHEMDLDEAELRATPFDEATCAEPDAVGERLWRPAGSIARLTRCEWWRSGPGINPVRITFLGLAHEVEVAGYLCAICARAMNDEVAKFDRHVALLKPDFRRRRRNAFLDGMSETLGERIAAMVKPEPAGKGLVVLRQAMVDGGFEVHYQPLVTLRSGEVSGCEALLRWRHPERGMVSPAEFIPVAEDTGLITELGDWVLRTACAEAAGWPDHIRLAVNVSPVQLKCQTLALRIAAALAASGLKPSRLEIEITEAVLIRDDEAALAILHQLRAIGVRIALDDFGTGFSSLSYLKRFPFDKIKIDRCFVSDISEADGSSSIVQAVVNIAAALNMTTTAEGVETDAQRELLRRLGCTEMQGYLFSAPKPGAEVRTLFGGARTDARAAG